MDTDAQNPDLDHGVIITTGDEAKGFRKIIEGFLLEQETSWVGQFDLDDLLNQLESGFYTAWLYRRDGVYLGLLLTSLQDYAWGGTVRIEFVTCKRFFALAKISTLLELYAANLGRVSIEAIAHPILAEYAKVKCGYHSPGVFIKKDLRPNRRN